MGLQKSAIVPAHSGLSVLRRRRRDAVSARSKADSAVAYTIR
jgi:hypothetical protein